MSKTVKITVDGQQIEARTGEKVLFAVLDQGLYIPHLCAHRGEERPGASCRLCFVEIEGFSRPVTSCTKIVEAGMEITTRSPRIDRLVATAFDLILSDHNLDCRNCPANRACALQRIARERKLKLRQGRFTPLQRDFTVDDSPESFAFDRSRCVLCGHCVRADREEAKVGAIGFARRGLNRVVTTFEDRSLADSICTQCLLCVEACPVGALYYKDSPPSSSK